MGLTERHWFENEDVPENYERDLEDAVYNSRANKKHDDDIVRCKDCKNWVGNGADIDKLPYWLPCKGEMRRPDYFCADGKRR
jgi:hypothetical protein